jgi:hypothetical protein
MLLISTSCSQDGILDVTVFGIAFFFELQEESDDERSADAPTDCAALRAAAFCRLELLFTDKLRRSAPIMLVLSDRDGNGTELRNFEAARRAFSCKNFRGGTH